MHTEDLIVSLTFIIVASIVIKYASDSFEEASAFLGRNMAPGIKGATINAVGSSMPELLTTAVFLFLYQDLDGFSAGVATAAGSAVFNALIIPSLCIIVVAVWGVKENGGTRKIRFIEVDTRTVVRDGFWLLVGEFALIYFLGKSILTWVAGAALMATYVGYFLHLMHHNKKFGPTTSEEEIESLEEPHAPKSKLAALTTFDFRTLFYGRKRFTDGAAWTVLACSVAVLGAACILLAEAVIRSAEALAIPTYFTAVVLAAAATSVPDTVLSVKDARNGLYDDAVSNALGSNIFDIAVSLGLPLLVYTFFYGSVELASATDASAAQVQILRIVLLWVTLAVIVLLLLGKKAGLTKACVMLLIYAVWMTWIADSAFHFGIFPA